MPDLFDRLLRENYYAGMRKFTPPIAPPFAPPAPKVAPAIQPAGEEVTAPAVPGVTPIEREEPPGPFLSGADFLAQPPSEEVEKAGPSLEERAMDRLSRWVPEKKPEPSFWGKIWEGTMSTFNWIESIDATSYGIIRGTIMAAVHGKTLWEELGIKQGQSIWGGAMDYTRRLGTAERLAGEIIFSPFNLLPVVGWGGVIARRMGLALPTVGGAAKGLARVTSQMAREQVLGEGIMHKWSPIRIMQGGLRARASMVLSDDFSRVLVTPNILGVAASDADDVVVRLRAFLERDVDTLRQSFHNPEKLVDEYISKETQAYYKAATRAEGFNAIVDDPQRFLGIAKTIKDPTGRRIVNPALRRIMEDMGGFMKNPGRYLEDVPGTRPMGADELTKVIDEATFPWDDYRIIIGGQEQNPIHVASEIFGRILQSAVPVTAKAARGQWNATHPFATLGNVMFRLHRGMLRHGLTHLYLLLRPAYTGYNQVMNFNMALLQNPLLRFRYYLDPATDVRRYAKELWGIEGDIPAYIQQGFGYGYMMGREAIEEEARLLGKTLPLLGEGKFAKAVKDIATGHHEVPVSDQPWIERIFGPLMNRPAGWVRGVNVGGEQYFRSMTYADTHYKTFNRMQRSMVKEMGVSEESLLSLSQYPDQLKAFVEGASVPAEYIAPRHLLDPYEMSLVDKAISELPENYSILDLVGAVKQAKKIAPRHYDELAIWYALRSGPRAASKALDDIAMTDVENAMRMAGYGDDEVAKNLDELTKALSPQEQKFIEHIRARPWTEKQKLYMDEYSTPELNVVWQRDLKMDEVFVDKLRVVAAEHHSEALRMVHAARAKGSEVFQKDIANVYQRMSSKKMKLYDLWAEQKDKLWAGAIEQSKTGLPLSTLDSPILMGTDEINNVLKMHGMDDMLNLEEATAGQMIEKARKSGMQSLDQFETQLLKNWEELGKLNKTLPIEQADLVRVRNTSMAYAKREGNRVSQYALFNYASRTNIDWMMSTTMPYPYWQTRFILHWATRCIDNPSQFNALVVLMKAWGESTKNLPTFLMASPFKLDLPDGSQVRFSPSMYFFPLSYTGLEVLRYGDQVNDTVDAVAMVQDFVGGYMYPTVELAMGMAAYGFDVPGYKTRGIGTAKNPVEIIKDLVPQLKLLRGALGHSPAAVKFALEHNLFTEADIALTIRTIGDALNSGELKDVRAAQEAIKDLQDGRANPIAIKYLGMTLQRKLWTDSARYSGMPVSKWYPEQQRSFYVQKLLYPEEGQPPSPDVQKQILAAYPGLEVTRGVTTPAGLDKPQERRWKASKAYYDAVDGAQQMYIEDLMGQLVEDFENPKEGAVISPHEFIQRRRTLYDRYRGVVDVARAKADKAGAPIEHDDRENFWRGVGRPVWPKHPLDELLNTYYDIEVAMFPGTTALDTDWQEFFKAREDFLMRLAPWERKWLEDYINDPARPDAAFRKAQLLVRPYWAIREAMIAKDPELENLLKQIEYWSVVDPEIADIYRKHPKVKEFNRVLDHMRRTFRQDNSDVEAALEKFWGYAPLGG